MTDKLKKIEDIKTVIAYLMGIDLLVFVIGLLLCIYAWSIGWKVALTALVLWLPGVLLWNGLTARYLEIRREDPEK